MIKTVFKLIISNPSFYTGVQLFAISRSPIIHVFCPPKFCTIKISLGTVEIEDNACAKFWGTKKVHCGRCANYECSLQI